MEGHTGTLQSAVDRASAKAEVTDLATVSKPGDQAWRDQQSPKVAVGEVFVQVAYFISDEFCKVQW